MAGRSGGGHSGGGHAGGGRSSVGGGYSGGGNSSTSSRHSGGGRSSSSASSFDDFFSSEPSQMNQKSCQRTTNANNYYCNSQGNIDGICVKISAIGCLVFIILSVLIFGMFILIDRIEDEIFYNPSSSNREVLPAGVVNETEYYTDEIGWISDKEALEKGMKNFYEKTGVQPYLYLTDQEVYGESVIHSEELADYAEELYQDLFTDEGHFLLVFFSSYDVNYVDYYICGYDAEEIMDSKAADILLYDLEDHFNDLTCENITREEYFSNAFDKTAIKIMPAKEGTEENTTNKSSETLLLIGLLILDLVLLLAVLLAGVFFLLRKFFKRKQKKAQEDMKIFQTSLKKFEDMEVESLEKKYKEP